MIKNADHLARKFGKLAEKTAAEAMGRAVENQMKIVQAEAKLLCPVDYGELRSSIRTETKTQDDKVIGTCYTNKAYAPYVEFGTGPRGQSSHAGISPQVSVAYTQAPWWIHESQLAPGTGEKYHWFYIDTPEGRFYQCSGQAAQPFMYPALADNKDRVTRNINNYIARKIREVSRE